MTGETGHRMAALPGGIGGMMWEKKHEVKRGIPREAPAGRTSLTLFDDAKQHAGGLHDFDVAVLFDEGDFAERFLVSSMLDAHFL